MYIASECLSDLSPVGMMLAQLYIHLSRRRRKLNILIGFTVEHYVQAKQKLTEKLTDAKLC